MALVTSGLAVVVINETFVKLEYSLIMFVSQHLNATFVISEPLANALTASASNKINKSHSGLRIDAMKLALDICSTLSNGIKLANAVDTTYKKCDNISIGNNNDVVSKLNISFNVAPIRFKH